MQLDLFIDGLCQPKNPGGIPCYAYLVKREEKTVYSESGLASEPFSSDATNNVAEYTALIKGLDWLLANGYSKTKIRVLSDSQLLVNQMQGRFRIRNQRIIPLFKKAASLSKQFEDLALEWIPREKNKEADALTTRAYNRAIIDNPSLLDGTETGIE